MKLTATYALLGASAIALAFPGVAYAQDAEAAADTTVPQEADAPENTGNVIIVQARRRDETIQDVPAVVNAVTAEAIAELNLRNFTEVATIVPGLELTTNANGTGGNARLRGVNFDTNASGNSATVEFYFNDAPISPGIILQQMWDIGQIEVQRGPQGTLRGRSSPSGSITVTTRKPDLYDYGGFVDATGNDIGTINFKGALNFPIIEGVLGVRVSGVFDENEADRVRPISNVDGRDPFSRTQGGRIVALLQPTDWLTFEGTYQRLDRDAGTYDQAISFSEGNPNAPASPVLIRDEDRLSITEERRQVRQVYDIYNWRAEAAFAGQRLIYQGQRTEQDIFSTENQDQANYFVGRDIIQATSTEAIGTSHEVRLQNEERLFGVVDYVVGFFDSKLRSPTTLNRPTAIALPLAFGGPGLLAQVVQTNIERGNRTHEQSYFGHLTVHVTDSTEISGGLRYIDFEQEGTLVINGALTAATAQNDDKLIYTASIRQEITPDISIYAATGSSYRPGINVVGDFNIAPSPLELSFVNLPPETSKSYEAGIKTNLFDGRVQFNVTAYYQDFKNFPYRSPNGIFFINSAPGASVGDPPLRSVSTFNFVGAVPVEVKGVEGELNVEINDNWNFNVVASYSDGKIQNGLVPCNDLNGDGVPDAVGATPSLAALEAAVGADNLSACNVSQRSAFLPPFSATVQSEYSLPVSDNVDGYLRGLFSFSGASQGDPTNEFDDVDEFGITNIYLGVRDPDGAWELSLFAKNIFDVTQTLTRGTPFFTSYQQLPGAVIGGVPTITGRPTAAVATSTYAGNFALGSLVNAPREFGVNFRYAFGSR